MVIHIISGFMRTQVATILLLHGHPTAAPSVQAHARAPIPAPPLPLCLWGQHIQEHLAHHVVIGILIQVVFGVLETRLFILSPHHQQVVILLQEQMLQMTLIFFL